MERPNQATLAASDMVTEWLLDADQCEANATRGRTRTESNDWLALADCLRKFAEGVKLLLGADEGLAHDVESHDVSLT